MCTIAPEWDTRPTSTQAASHGASSEDPTLSSDLTSIWQQQSVPLQGQRGVEKVKMIVRQRSWKEVGGHAASLTTPSA